MQHDLIQALTAVSTVPASLILIKIAFGQPEGRGSVWNVLKGIGFALGIPTMVHLIATLCLAR